MDDSGAEDWSPRGGTGGRHDGRTERGALRRRLGGGAARCARAVRVVPVGVVVAGVVTLAGMTLVLHMAGAWPFARPGVDARSVPGARLPLPPSAVGPGESPSDGESGDGNGGNGEGAGGGEAEGMGATAGSGSGSGSGDGDGTDGGPAMTQPPPGQAMPGRDEGAGDSGCRATWRVDTQWDDFNATVRVTATAGATVRGWQVTWTWPDGQRLAKGWDADFRQSGADVAVRNGPGNAEIAAGGETTFGFQATGSGSPAPRLVCRAL